MDETGLSDVPASASTGAIGVSAALAGTSCCTRGWLAGAASTSTSSLISMARCEKNPSQEAEDQTQLQQTRRALQARRGAHSSLCPRNLRPQPQQTMSTSPTTWVLVWYVGILPVIWLAPAITSWLKRRHHRGSSAKTSDMAPGGFVLTSEAAKLELAEQSRTRIYKRVSGALWQAGWCVWWAFFLPYITLFLVRE